ncbi:MAG: hypothetical protein ACXACY_29135 [Candidatus Hodarchaeales archaeon]|jgi:hypothetical protein
MVESFKVYEDISIFGNSDLKTKDLFVQRKGYDALYPSVVNPLLPEPIDYRSRGYQKYGLVNTRKEYIIPDSAYLKPVAGTEGEIYALNFVADAYQDFLFYMNTKGTIKMMEDGGRLKKQMSAKKGWKDPDADFESLKTGLYEAFLESFLNIEYRKRINNFQGFMDVFLNFYLNFMNFDVPVTYTGMMQSSFADPRHSGLCIHLETGDLDDDYDKFDRYLNNRNYKEYVTAAAAFGFMVDKHVPWRLVANIASPKMKAYMSNYMNLYTAPRQGYVELTTTPYLSNGSTHAHSYFIDEYGNGFTDEHTAPGNLNKHHGHQIVDYKIIPNGTPKANEPNTGIGPHIHSIQIMSTNWSTKDFYNEYFFKTNEVDLQSIKDMMFEFYNNYVDFQPFSTVPKSCKPNVKIDELGKTNFALLPLEVGKIYRDQISKEKYDAEYDDLFWYKIYFLIRLREVRANIIQKKITKALGKIEYLYLTVDKETSMSYINRYLKQYY